MEIPVYQFKFVHENKWGEQFINRFEAHIPQFDCTTDTPQKVESYHPYIKLQLGNEMAVLKTIQQDSRLCQISIHTSVFAGQNLSGVVVAPATKEEWLKYKRRKIKFMEGGKPALYLGTAGLLIDGAFALGKANEKFVVRHLGDNEMLFWMLLAIALKIVALYLLYKKSISEAK